MELPRHTQTMWRNSLENIKWEDGGQGMMYLHVSVYLRLNRFTTMSNGSADPPKSWFTSCFLSTTCYQVLWCSYSQYEFSILNTRMK